MIYVDTSVVLAELLAEDRSPPARLWESDLVSSRLLDLQSICATTVLCLETSVSQQQTDQDLPVRFRELESTLVLLDRSRVHGS